MATLATLVVDLTANTGEYQKGMSAATKITKSATKSIQTIGKAALGIGVAGIAALGFGFVKVAQKAIPAASDLEESLNKVDVVFGDMAESIKDFASDAATGLGQSQAQALEAAGTFGNLLTSIGIIPEKAAEMSTGFVTLASDLASFNNASPEETLLALRSALTGEFEPMKRFGVALSQAAVAEQAMKMGLIETTAELTPAIKSMAGYALIMEQTTNAQGDFARTSEGLANSQRIVEAQMEDLMATIGSFLLPIAEAFFGFLSGTAMPILDTFGKYIGAVVGEGDNLGDLLGDMPGWLQPIALTIGEVIKAFQGFFDLLAGGMAPLEALPHLASALGQAFGMSQEAASGLFLQVQNLIVGLTNFKDRMVEFITPIIEFIANTVTWNDVLIALGITIAAVLIPIIISLLATILPIILVGAALIAMVTLVRTAWEENWGGIQEKTAAVIAWFQVSIPAALEFITNLWDEHGAVITATATELWEGIQSVIESTIVIVKTVIGAALQFIMEIWNKHGAQITKAVKAIWDAIKTVFRSAVTIVKNIFKAFAALFKGDWKALGGALKNIWRALWNAIKSIFRAAKQVLTTVFGILKTVLTNLWSRLKIALTNLWTLLWNAIKAKFIEVKNIIRNILITWIDLIRSKWLTFKNKIAEIWETGWQAIIDFFITTKDAIILKIEEFIKSVIAFFTDTDWIQLGKDIIKGIADGVGAAAGLLASAARDAAKKAWKAIKDFFGFGSPPKVMVTMGIGIIEGLALGMEQISRIEQAIEGFTVPFRNLDPIEMELRSFTGDLPLPSEPSAGAGGAATAGPVIVYGGLHLHGVDDSESLADELMELRA